MYVSYFIRPCLFTLGANRKIPELGMLHTYVRRYLRRYCTTYIGTYYKVPTSPLRCATQRNATQRNAMQQRNTTRLIIEKIKRKPMSTKRSGGRKELERWE